MGSEENVILGEGIRTIGMAELRQDSRDTWNDVG